MCVFLQRKSQQWHFCHSLKLPALSFPLSSARLSSAPKRNQWAASRPLRPCMHGVWEDHRCLSGAGSGCGVWCSSLEGSREYPALLEPGQETWLSERPVVPWCPLMGWMPPWFSPVSLLGLCRVSPDSSRSAGAQRRDDQGTAQWGSAPGFPDAGGNDSSSQGRPVPQPRGAAGESCRSALRPAPAPPPTPSRLPAGLCPPWAKASLTLLSGSTAHYKSVTLIT